MKVKDLIEELKKYNQEAELSVISDYKKQDFSITFGDSEGESKETATSVNFYLLNQKSDS